MTELHEDFLISLMVSPLLFFALAVGFRLLDNSALLFLQKEILVSSSDVSEKCIKHQISHHSDVNFKKKLRTALLYRKLYHTFLVLMFLSLPLMFLGYFQLN